MACDVVPDDAVRAAVELAQRAPSVHNTQPWRWVRTDRALELWFDRPLRLLHADPDGRDLELSVGCALHHLRVAAAAYGLACHVRRLPEAALPDLAAVVSFRPAPVTADALTRAACLRERRTDRRMPRPVAAPELRRLARAAAPHRTRAVVLRTEQQRRQLVELTRLATRLQLSDPEARAELERVTADHPESGVPSGNRIARPAGSLFVPPTRFPAGTLTDPSAEVDAESDLAGPDHAIGWLLLATPDDTTLDRLHAGEALSALLVDAATRDLVAVPSSQAAEVPGTRARIEASLLGGDRLQLALRVGTRDPALPPVPPTPRRRPETSRPG